MRGILFSITTFDFLFYFHFMSFMSPEFTPQTPGVVHAPGVVAAEDMNNNGINTLVRTLEKNLKAKQTIAEDVYGRYRPTAREMDKKYEEESNCVVALNEGANILASLLTKACIRGAQRAQIA